MTVNGFAGQVIPSNVTVYMGPLCDFRYGLSSFADLDRTPPTFASWASCSRIQSDGQLVLWARHVDGFDFTDTTTAPTQP